MADALATRKPGAKALVERIRRAICFSGPAMLHAMLTSLLCYHGLNPPVTEAVTFKVMKDSRKNKHVDDEGPCGRGLNKSQPVTKTEGRSGYRKG
jgi:hypothetical protein